jgi:predicted nucleotidyltransferase
MYLPTLDIQKIRQVMRGKPVHKVYLFCSYARGQATSDSDIDLLIEFDYTKLNKEYDYFDIKFEVEDYLQKRVDLVSAKMLSSSKIAPFVEHDKILIYENT